MKKIFLTLGIASYSSYGQDNTFPTPSGNVGIGTTGPQHKLHVVNTGAVIGMVENTSSTADARVIAKNTLDQLQMGMDNTGGYFQLVGTNPLRTIVNNAERMRITSSGNVGIGTPNPVGAYLLTIAGSGNSNTPVGAIALKQGSSDGFYVGYGSATNNDDDVELYNANNGYMRFATNNAERMRIHANGNVGIGTTSPGAPLHVYGMHPSNTKTMQIGAGTSASAKFYKADGLDVIDGPLYLQGNYNQNVLIGLGGGNVGIGTTGPDQKLTVKGKIHSSEVIVDAMTTVPDYVFEPDYKLTSLSEVKAYVEKNHHLPEIPSAKEIEKNGIQLGDMNMKLLKKIEELTLYLIEKDKQISILQDDVIKLKQQMASTTKN